MATMTPNPAELPLPERFDHLLKLISSERFLKMQGLGNEVPFFICPFSPREAVQMTQLAHQLANRLAQQGVQVLEVDLYDHIIPVSKGVSSTERNVQVLCERCNRQKAARIM